MWYRLARQPGKKYDNKLFHGGLRENLQAIEQMGIIPQLGPFVEEMYGREYDDDAWNQVQENSQYSYWATYEELRKAINAIKHHIAKKKGIHSSEVTPLDIKEFGLLAMTHPDEDFAKADKDNYGSHKKYNEENRDFTDSWWNDEDSVGIEPGDVFTKDSVYPDKIYTGKKLLSLLNKFNLPRPQQINRQDKVRQLREKQREEAQHVV